MIRAGKPSYEQIHSWGHSFETLLNDRCKFDIIIIIIIIIVIVIKCILELPIAKTN